MDNAFICTTMHTNWGQRITWKCTNRNSTMTWKCSSTAWRVLISFSSQILACYIHLLRSQLALVEHRLSQPCFSQLSPLTPWSVPGVSSAGPSTIFVFCPSAHELSFWNRMVENQTPYSISPTHHGGPYFSFLVVQQPRCVAIANNCKALSWLKRMADMSVFINLHLNSRQSKSDCKAKQK